MEVNSAESEQALVAMDNQPTWLPLAPSLCSRKKKSRSQSRGQRTAAGRMRSAWFWAVPLCLATCGKIGRRRLNKPPSPGIPFSSSSPCSRKSIPERDEVLSRRFTPCGRCPITASLV